MINLRKSPLTQDELAKEQEVKAFINHIQSNVSMAFSLESLLYILEEAVKETKDKSL